MRGRPRKHPDQLQDRRPSRRRPMIALDLGGGVVWTVPANSLAALSKTTPRAPWREPVPSPKAVIARAKPRDRRGRFLPAAPGDTGQIPATPADPGASSS